MMDRVYEHDGVAVSYKFREAKQDRRHLVVVFAGVKPGEHDFYGFDGYALDNVKGAVLWIKDSFEERNAYYMCAGMDFKIKEAVTALIDHTLDDLQLTPTDCTLLGGSKGGSAALHLGLSNDYANVVAVVPQSRVGTYARYKLRETFAYMASDDPDGSEAALNSHIPNLISNPSSLSKNIYLVSSRSDPEYGEHIDPILEGLSRFENFNLLLTDSTLVQSHPDVTPYNVPFILSALYALCEGLAPRYGYVENGNGEQDRLSAAEYFSRNGSPQQSAAAFHWVQVRGESLTFRAYAAMIGEATTSEPTTPPQLLAIGRESTHRYELDWAVDKTLNAKLYRRHFCDYRWSGIRTPGDKGISLGSLPAGTYDLHVDFKTPSGNHQAGLPGRDSQKMTGIFGGYAYHLDSSTSATRISKVPLNGNVPADGEFRITSLATNDATLYLEGMFAVPREEMRAWNDGTFAVTLTNDTRTISFPLGAMRASAGHDLPLTFDRDAFAWAHFSTPGRRGIELTRLQDGLYDCYVSFLRGTRAYTGSQRFTIAMARGTASLRSTAPS